MHNNLNLILEKLLQKNNIYFNREELKFQITSHPSYPSLHAITGVLDHFDIDNLALDIPQNNDIYQQLPSYFIAQLQNTSSESLVFIDKRKEQVIVTFPNKKTKNLTKPQFLEQWSGVVVVINEENFIFNKNRLTKKLIKLLPLVLLTTIIVFTYINQHTYNSFGLLHFLLATTGVYISLLLLRYEFGIHSQTVSKICNATKKTNCETVLNSKSANLFGLFKLNDLSYIYFTSISITEIIYSLNYINHFNTIALLSLLCIPIIFYTIFHQAIVIKKWCPLCLIIIGILLIQSIISYFINPLTFTFELNGVLILASIFLTTVIIYSNLKPIIISKIALTKSKIAYFKFKRNYTLFEVVHSKNLPIKTEIFQLDEIIFGNKSAKTEIIVITNPMCGFCKKTHQEIENLLNKNGDDIKVVIRFNINTDKTKSFSYQISSILQNLYKENEIACKDAINQIYSNDINIEKWLKNYKKFDTNSSLKLLKTQKNWCLENNINFTPSIYLNQRAFPKEYELSDLNFFINNLIEEAKTISSEIEIN